MECGVFEEYEVPEDTSITFCLKEFKAILNFCEAAGQLLTIFFDRAGRPALATVAYFGLFEVNFHRIFILYSDRIL